MKNGLAVGLAVILAGNAQGATDVAVPLAPVGKWAVDTEDGMCTLTRSFGGTPDLVPFGLQPTTLGETTRVAVVVPKDVAGRSAKRVKARLTTLPAGTSIPIKYERNGPTADGGKAAFMIIDRADVPALMAAAGVEIGTSGFTVSIATTAGAKALAALTTCETQLMTGWGVDPAMVAAVATPARGAPDIAEWVRVSDYPTSALARKSQGASVILWRIDSDGAIRGCRTVKSAGDADLDTAACHAVSTRGRYTPALDTAGHPVPSWVTRTVTWRMPGSR
jgi:TonB family protein